MANLIKMAKRDEVKSKNESTILNSAVKCRESTLDYHKIRNQVEQKYYHKSHGCSVRIQE